MFFKATVACVWLLSWLPFKAISALGWLVGHLIASIPSSRRHIGRVNLRRCLPDWTEADRTRLLRRHFVAMVQMLQAFDAHLKQHEGRPVILMMPHFTGLDLAGLRVSLETELVSIYSRQKDPWLDEFFRTRRLRLGTGIIFSRQQGTRAVIRALRDGYRLYYLPDQDFGHRDSVFVPFFGVNAATITGLSRMAMVAGAAVLPCYPRREATGYTLVIEPALDNFPTNDAAADAARMNAVIEAQIRRQPYQYFWLHKRFKSRPPGEADFYG